MRVHLVAVATLVSVSSCIAHSHLQKRDGQVSTVRVDESEWQRLCSKGSTLQTACFHLTSGTYSDYLVQSAQADKVFFSGKHHFFGVKCPGPRDDSVVIYVAKRGILDVTLYADKVHCGWLLDVEGQGGHLNIVEAGKFVPFP